MDYRILGPLEVYDGSGERVRLAAGRERGLLVALLLRRGEVVSADALVEALWGAEPPPTAGKALQGHVSHLRRAFDAAGANGARALETQNPGYVLRARAEEVDAARFERLAADGRRALDDGAAAEAAELLGEALALWRGDALVEFAFDEFAQTEIRRLEELRLGAIEDSVDARLQTGRDGGLVSELEALVAAHPLRSRLRGALMLALYRSGRQADALQVYRDGRRLLASELGLDPDPELQRLEQAILTRDPSLGPVAAAITARAAPSTPSERPRPRRRRRAALLGALAVAVALAAVAAFLLSRDDDPAPAAAAAVEVAVPSVVALDAATGRVVASVRTGSWPVTLDAYDGRIWVGDSHDSTVTVIDGATRAVERTVGVGAPVVDLAANEQGVWVATGSFGEVLRVDAAAGSVAEHISLARPDEIEIPSVLSIAADDRYLWVGALDGLVRIDPRTRSERRVDLGAPALQVAADDESVWATVQSFRAKRVEPASAQVTAEVETGEFAYALALGAGAAWISAGEQIRQVDSATGSTIGSAPLPGVPIGIAAGPEGVWAALGNGSVVHLDSATARVLEAIPLSDGVLEDVALLDGLVWVALHSNS